MVAVLLAVSGGFRFTVGGLRVSARSPMAPAIAALAMLAAWAWLASRHRDATREGAREAAREAARDLTAFWSAIDRSAWTIVIALAAVSVGIATAFGTFAAAGADPSGYLSQSAMWAAGRLRLSDPLPLMAGWPPDAGVSAPLGWNPSADRGWQVPTYGPGLPLLMAVPHAVGGPIAACLVVAVSAAIAVLATGSIAFRLASRPAAIVAAVTLATCPAFIFQSVQPMSDVPVTAAWMVGWALLIRSPAFARVSSDELRRGSFLAGVACAIAVLIRPNLAPLAIVPFVYLLFLARGTFGTPRTLGTHPFGTLGTHPFGTLGTLGTLGTRRRSRIISERAMARQAFVVPVALAGVFLAWLQWHWYGSPLRSGYGTVEQLYSFSSVGPNASRYATWLLSTSPVLLLALVGVSIRRSAETWALAAFAVLNLAAYLAYFVFDQWPYLRFVLPAIAIASVFTGVALAALVDRVAVPARAVVFLAAALVIAAAGLWRARALDAFRLSDAQRRVVQIDRYLESALPERAVIVAGEQSGAVRFDTGHPIVRWEAASRDDLISALRVLDADRRPVWILLDAWEEPLVRAKFGGVELAALDWPPAVDAGETRRTRAWNLADRARFFKGERVVTDRLR
jgi:hypothetical protein